MQYFIYIYISENIHELGVYLRLNKPNVNVCRPLSGCSKEEPVSEAEPPAPKGRRRRLLQPAKPMSNQMKAALGDWESNDCGVLKDIAAAKLGGGTAGQKKGAAGAAAGSAKAGGGRMVPLSPAMFSPKQFRTRRQTALHKAAK